jgi:hypothetical protein
VSPFPTQSLGPVLRAQRGPRPSHVVRHLPVATGSLIAVVVPGKAPRAPTRLIVAKAFNCGLLRPLPPGLAQPPQASRFAFQPGEFRRVQRIRDPLCTVSGIRTPGSGRGTTKGRWCYSFSDGFAQHRADRCSRRAGVPAARRLSGPSVTTPPGQRTENDRLL